MRTHIFRYPYRPSPHLRYVFLKLIIACVIIYYLPLLRRQPPPTTDVSPQLPPTATTIRHILFSIGSSFKTYSNRKPYIRLWYDPETIRSYTFLDRPAAYPDPELPPIIISGETSKFPYTYPGGLRSAIRLARIVKEAVELNETDVRWFVFGDDDTVFFTENLVRLLSNYDHEKWYYIGSNSESLEQNEEFSFDMAFGGGGFAISSGLARALATVLDSCLMRYPHLYGSDARIFSCLVELGVELTHEPGFHQADVHGDISGLLSAHPLSPLLSLHHLDTVDPIFPGMNRLQAMDRLLEAVYADPASVLQRTVCYDNAKSLTVSVSWGYVVQLYEGNHLLPDLLAVQKSFTPWKRGSSRYMFNTKDYPIDPCKRPVTFFLETVIPIADDEVYTSYTSRLSESCSRTKAIQSLERIAVYSKRLDLDTGEAKAPRRQCCDISTYTETMNINIRECRVDELISMPT